MTIPDARALARGAAIAIAAIWLCIVPLHSPAEAQTADRPSLLFGQADIPLLRLRAATTHREIWEPIRAYVERQLRSSAPAVPPADGDVDTYRSYGNRLIPMAMVCVIEQEPQYCNLAHDYLMTITSWQQWGEQNRRGLGHAHIVFGVSLAYDWLYETLTPEERTAVAVALGQKAHELYEASASPRNVSAWGNWWRFSYAQNHYPIIHSALGMAGLALRDTDDRAWIWTDHAQEKMYHFQFILDGIDDGSWHEGIAYQNYFLTMMLPFAISLRQIYDIHVLPARYMSNYVYWRIYNLLPSSRENALTHGNYDLSWVNSYEPQSILRFAAGEYNNPRAEWAARQIISASGRRANLDAAPWNVFEFLYYDDSIAPQPPDDLPLAQTFSDMQAVIWRTGWDDDDLVFGLYSGSFGGNFTSQTFIDGTYPWNPPCTRTGCSLNVGHNHADAANFSLYQAGTWLIYETIGTGNAATSFHNTLLIDGAGQYRPPSSNFGEVVDDFVNRSGFLRTSVSSHSFDYVAADATRRYDVPDLREFTRHVLFVRPHYFVMLDNLAAQSPHRYEWVAHFPAGVSIDGDWVRGESGGEQVVGVGIVGPPSYVVTTGNDGSPYMRSRPLASVDNARLIHILYPTHAESWDTRPAFDLLQDDDTAAALRIWMDDNSFDDVLIVYNPTPAGTVVGDYRFDGQAAFVKKHVNGDLQQVFIQGGTFLADVSEDDVILIAQSDNSEPFEAVFIGDTVEVWGQFSDPVTLYAPGVRRLLVNGTQSDFIRDCDHIIFPVSSMAALNDTASAELSSQIAGAAFSVPGDRVGEQPCAR